MANEKRLIAYDPITFESFIRHATKHIDPYYDPYGEGFTDAVDNIEGWLKNNTVDAVEVVRCKDCIYYEIGKDYEPYCNHVTHGIPYPKADDFCSYGERKDNV
jgi:hypothetical protein